MKKRIWGIGLVILLILGLVVVVAGCGGGGTTTTAKGTATTAAEKPVAGGTLRWVSGSQPAGNQVGIPWKWNASVPAYLLPVVEPLLVADATGALQPWLAKSWDIGSDNLSITFHLRDDVKFSDGTAFNADAVKWNIDQQIAAKAPTTGLMTSCDKVDEYTVKINLKSWDGTLLNQMTNSIQDLFMISPTAYQKNGDKGAETQLVGTGPFLLQSWDATTGAKMVKNPNYWQTGKPYLDEIDFTFLTDPTAAIMAVKGGQADVGYFFRGSLVDQKAALADAGYPMYYYKNGMGIYAMFPDSGNPSSVLANATLRQAIEYATDKETLCKTVGHGLWTPVWQACPPSNAAYDANLQPQRKFDIAKAKDLLKQANYSGQVINLYTLQSDSALAQAIQAMWKTAGIESNIQLMDQPSWVAKMGKGWTDGYLISAIGANPVWVSALPRYLAAPPISYVSMARSDAVSTALADARAQKDLTSIIAKTKEIVKAVNDDATLLPLFMHEADYNVSNKVHNFGYDISGQWNAADIWISK